MRRYNNIMRENFFLKEKIESFINFGSLGDQDQSKDEKRAKKTGRKKK